MRLDVTLRDEASPKERVYPDRRGMDEVLANVILGSKGQIKRVEFVRIIAQALYSLGYENSAELLEKEAAIPLKSATVSQFRKEIREAHWDKSIETLHTIGPLDSYTRNEVTYLILERKLLEQMLRGEQGMALKTLRSEIARLQIPTQRLRKLANCVVFPTHNDISNVFMSASGKDAHETLLLEIQSLLSPERMISEKRLQNLIEQALAAQINSCLLHNADDKLLTLYTDHHCGCEQIPNQTLQVLCGHKDEVWVLKFSHNGKFLASSSKDCTAIIWEIGDNYNVVLKLTLIGHEEPVSILDWSPNDSMLLTCSNKTTIRLWDSRTGVFFKKIELGSDMVSCATWLPSGKQFFFAGSKGVYTWHLDGDVMINWFFSSLECTSLAITSDGIHLVVVYANRMLSIRNLVNSKENAMKELYPISSISVSNDNKYLIANVHRSQEIHLWDIVLKVSLGTFVGHRQESFVIGSCFGGPNNDFIISGSEDSQVYIWNRSNKELLKVLPGHAGAVNCVSWNPKNPFMFASASDDHTIRIWGPSTKA